MGFGGSDFFNIGYTVYVSSYMVYRVCRIEHGLANGVCADCVLYCHHVYGDQTMTFDQKLAFFRKLFRLMKVEDIDTWAPFATGALTMEEREVLNPTSSFPVESPDASSQSAPESARGESAPDREPFQS